MLKAQSNKLNMLKAVRQSCEKHESVWSVIPGFVETFNKLKAVLAEIDAEMKIQDRNNTGIAENKIKLRDDMISLAKWVSGAIVSYATEIRDFDLVNSFSRSESELQTLKANQCLAYCQEVHKKAVEMTEQIGPLGISQEVLDEFQNNITEYSVLLASPRIAISRRKVATSRLKELFQDAMLILNNQLDRLMENFCKSVPEFYREYFVARSIINLKGGGRTNAEENEDDSIQDQPSQEVPEDPEDSEAAA